MPTIRNSAQRNLVMKIITGNAMHYTADEIYELAKKEDPKISRGTVYRNLGQLEEMGKLQRIMMPVGPDHYDYKVEPHYHFFCKKCQRVYDAPIPYEVKWNEEAFQKNGFKVEDHQLLFMGECPHCSGKDN